MYCLSDIICTVINGIGNIVQFNQIGDKKCYKILEPNDCPDKEKRHFNNFTLLFGEDIRIYSSKIKDYISIQDKNKTGFNSFMTENLLCKDTSGLQEVYTTICELIQNGDWLTSISERIDFSIYWKYLKDCENLKETKFDEVSFQSNVLRKIDFKDDVFKNEEVEIRTSVKNNLICLLDKIEDSEKNKKDKDHYIDVFDIDIYNKTFLASLELEELIRLLVAICLYNCETEYTGKKKDKIDAAREKLKKFIRINYIIQSTDLNLVPYYKKICQTCNKLIEETDIDSRRLVDRYVFPKIKNKQKLAEPLLKHRKEEIIRKSIIAEAGLGKSSLLYIIACVLSYTACDSICEEQEDYGALEEISPDAIRDLRNSLGIERNDLIPVLIPVADYKDEDKKIVCVGEDTVEDWKEKIASSKDKEVLILLDGLDELRPDYYNGFFEAVNEFLGYLRKKKIIYHIVFTCRLINTAPIYSGFDFSKEDITELYLQPWGKEEKQKYLEGMSDCFGNTVKDFVNLDLITENEYLNEISNNPYLFIRLLQYYRTDSKSRPYKLIDLLCEDLISKKWGTIFNEVENREDYQRCFCEILQYIAMQLLINNEQENDNPVFNRDDFNYYVNEYCQHSINSNYENLFNAENRTKLIENMNITAGMIVYRNREYCFINSVFWKFFAAKGLYYQIINDNDEKLVEIRNDISFIKNQARYVDLNYMFVEDERDNLRELLSSILEKIKKIDPCNIEASDLGETVDRIFSYVICSKAWTDVLVMFFSICTKIRGDYRISKMMFQKLLCMGLGADNDGRKKQVADIFEKLLNKEFGDNQIRNIDYGESCMDIFLKTVGKKINN